MGLSGFSVNVRSTQKRFINIYNADDNEFSGSESAIRYVKFFPFVTVSPAVVLGRAARAGLGLIPSRRHGADASSGCRAAPHG